MRSDCGQRFAIRLACVDARYGMSRSTGPSHAPVRLLLTGITLTGRRRPGRVKGGGCDRKWAVHRARRAGATMPVTSATASPPGRVLRVEGRIGALGLALNALVLFTSRHRNTALYPTAHGQLEGVWLP
jgi:hypothetical protein